MAIADVDAFLEQLEEAVGEAPVFTGRDDAKSAMGQFYEWIKWSGKRDLFRTMRERLKPSKIEEA